MLEIYFTNYVSLLVSVICTKQEEINQTVKQQRFRLYLVVHVLTNLRQCSKYNIMLSY